MAAADPATAPARTPLEWMTLLAIVALGVYVRVDDLDAWWAQPEQAFHLGMPLLLNLDGYYFLALARDLLEGTYDAIDPLRAAPAGAARPALPPLLALVTAGIARLFQAPLDWVATLLPAAAGPLVALPVYALARRIAGATAGLSAALITVVSHYLVFRSTLGFYDTDCLNVFFTMALIGWSVSLPRDARAGFARWLGLGLLLYLGFAWWWSGATLVVSAIAGWSLVCALGARGWQRRDLLAAGAGVGGVLLAALAWLGAALPRTVLDLLRGTVSHVTKADQGEFPNIALSIGEQVPANLAQFAEKTTGDPLLLAVAAFGLGWLMLRHPRVGIALLAPLGLAVLSVLYAQRFLIFAAPLAGLGVGYLAARGIIAVGRAWWLRGAVVVGVLSSAGPSLARSVSIDFMPIAGSELVAGMHWVARNTPEDAVVWAMWDYGYTLRYWGERATVNDGSVHTGEVTVYNALPFAAHSFRQAANFMQFYAVHGVPGLHRMYAAAGGAGPGLALARRIFAAGPGATPPILAAAGIAPLPEPGGWPAFLFPAAAPSLYLFLDNRMLLSTYWWYWFGSFDVAAGAGHHGYLQPFHGVREEGPWLRAESLRVDLRTGALERAGEPPSRLSRVVLGGAGGIRQHRFQPGGLEFQLFAPQALGVLQDSQVAQSVFSKAFVLKATAAGYFTAAAPWTGTYQIWRVRGDAPP